MGRLPESEADQLLKLCPAKPEKKPANKNTSQKFVKKSDLTEALHQATTGGEGRVQVWLIINVTSTISNECHKTKTNVITLLIIADLCTQHNQTNQNLQNIIIHEHGVKHWKTCTSKLW